MPSAHAGLGWQPGLLHLVSADVPPRTGEVHPRVGQHRGGAAALLGVAADPGQREFHTFYRALPERAAAETYGGCEVQPAPVRLHRGPVNSEEPDALDLVPQHQPGALVEPGRDQPIRLRADDPRGEQLRHDRANGGDPEQRQLRAVLPAAAGPAEAAETGVLRAGRQAHFPVRPAAVVAQGRKAAGTLLLQGRAVSAAFLAPAAKHSCQHHGKGSCVILNLHFMIAYHCMSLHTDLFLLTIINTVVL